LSARPKITSKYVGIFQLIWLSGTASGFFLLGAYHARPGQPGKPLVRWPEESPVRLDPDRPTLLIFLHPRCPCSRASVAEIASIAASYPDRFAVHAILYQPEGPSEDWDRAEAAAAEEAPIPGLRRWTDRGGRLGRRFGVETSGHVLLFDPDGGLLFEGGITPSRGHRGGNLGLEALVARIERRDVGAGSSPIFGCPILDPASASRAELIR
jgi:hypothetical protein